MSFTVIKIISILYWLSCSFFIYVILAKDFGQSFSLFIKCLLWPFYPIAAIETFLSTTKFIEESIKHVENTNLKCVDYTYVGISNAIEAVPIGWIVSCIGQVPDGRWICILVNLKTGQYAKTNGPTNSFINAILEASKNAGSIGN